MQEKLKPLEALSLLSQATASLNLNRESHLKILEALQVLNAELQPKPKLEPREEGQA